jgi:hypothetical protein
MPNIFYILSEVFVFSKPVDKENCCRKLKMIENAHFCGDISPIFVLILVGAKAKKYHFHR